MISLASLKPQILDFKIAVNGEVITVPAMPLTYVQWNSALIGIIPPKAPSKRKVEDPSKPPVDYLDYEDLEYKRLVVAYNNEIKARRVATSLAGAGMAELQGLSLEEQAKKISELDAGILNALYENLERMATKRTGAWFQRKSEQLSGDNDADSPAHEHEPDGIPATS